MEELKGRVRGECAQKYIAGMYEILKELMNFFKGLQYDNRAILGMRW